MENKILVVVGEDGRILHTEQEGVFRRSNKQNELIALLPYASTSVVKVNFLRADGVKPKSQYMSWNGEREYIGKTYNAYTYFLTDFQLNSTGPLVVSLDIESKSITATTGDFIIDVEASEGEYDDDTPSDTNQYDEAIKVLMKMDSVLFDRTENVPFLVKSIQKVEGVDNAFTYTDNSGTVSERITIGEGTQTPTLKNNASKITIKSDSWVARFVGTDIAEYYYIVMAGLHGQMRDDAKADDLWVGFDEASGTSYLGAFKRYEVNAAGDVTVFVNQPVTLTVRVWNGKGGYDGEAREEIASETMRAEAAEESLQTQISELVNTGIDRVAREQVTAETTRAENAENKIVESLKKESERAQTAEATLGNSIAAIVQTVSFTSSGLWGAASAATRYLGYLSLSLSVPTGKRIVQVLDENNMPRGTWRGRYLYANEPFTGVAIII